MGLGVVAAVSCVLKVWKLKHNRLRMIMLFCRTRVSLTSVGALHSGHLNHSSLSPTHCGRLRPSQR